MSETQSKPLRKLKASLWDRFHAKIEPVTESGCWIWTASTYANGYGMIHVGPGHKASPAQRVAWRLYYGDIPTDYYVLHRCDVRPCVNPAHLYLGTAKDNQRDAWDRGRQYPMQGERHGRAKLTEELVRHIADRQMSSRKYARLYGVSRRAIRDIWAGLTWQSVTKRR